MGPTLRPIVAAIVSTVAFAQDAAPEDDYVARFERALAAFDRGAYEDAAAAFELAGKLAWSAPVWRVHRAIALERSGDLDGAREEAVEALRRGYPVSDLRAIDSLLLPSDPVEADLAPERNAAVLRLGVDAGPGWGDCRVENDLAVWHGRAWSLVTGELEATQRRRDREIVAHRIHPDGRREPVHELRRNPRWDHVDGSVLEDPFTRAKASRGHATVSDERVASFSMDAVRRGLRSGLWCEASRTLGRPVFLDGARLALEESRPRWDQVGTERVPVLDLARLEVEVVDVAPVESKSLVRDAETLEHVADRLGAPLGTSDRVHRFEGVDELVVTRNGDGHEDPMLVLDPADGSVVARPKVAPDAWFSYSLGPIVHVPEHALLLLSNGSGSTLEAISTRTWEVVWREPWSSNSGFRRRIRVRGDRVYSYATSPSHTDVHEVESGKSIFDGSSTHFTAIDGSDDGRWIAASASGALHVLDPITFEPFVELWLEENDGGPARVCAVATDGTFDVPVEQLGRTEVLLVGHGLQPAADVAPWLWDPLHVRSLRDDADRSSRHVDTKKIARVAQVTFEKPDAVVLAEDAPAVVVLGRGGALRVLNAEDGELLAEAMGWRARGWALDVSPDGELVALLTRDGRIYLWPWRDQEQPKPIGQLEGQAAWANSRFGGHVSFSPSGHRILLSHDSSDRLLLDREGNVVAAIPRQRHTIEVDDEDGWRPVMASGFRDAVAWDPTGGSFALVTEGRPAFHDATTGAPLDVELSQHDESVLTLAFGPDGRSLIAGTFRGHVVRWDVESGEIVWDHEHRDPFWGLHDDNGYWIGLGDVAVSPDGAWVAATTTPGIHALLLDARTGERQWIGEFRGGRMGEPAPITWSRDSGCFYYAYLSGAAEVVRVVLGDESDRKRSPLVIELMAGPPLDAGWTGLTVGVTKEGVLARSGSTGELRWAR
ncbi:MAG: hypothetical protein AAGI22_17635 [Planctomycetota bacterium]